MFNFAATLSLNYPSAPTPGPDGTLYAAGEALFHFDPSTGDFQEAVLPFPLENELPSVPTSGLTVGPNGNLDGLYTIYPQPGAEFSKWGWTAVISNSSRSTPRIEALPESAASHRWQLLASRIRQRHYRLRRYRDAIAIGRCAAGDGYDVHRDDPVGAFPAAMKQAKDGTFWGATQSFGRASKAFSPTAEYST